LTSLLIAHAALSGHVRLSVVGLALVGLVLGFTAIRLPRLAFGIGAPAAIAVASASAVVLLSERDDFAYVPSLTPVSAVALAVIAAWLVLRSFGWEPHAFAIIGATERSGARQIPTFGAVLAAFFWTRAELAGAWSVTASTALLIVYYAATGTYAIWLGRRRGPKVLRVAGLALTLWAGKALVEATNVSNVPVRVGLYFVVARS
jgi:hypothetical protein